MSIGRDFDLKVDAAIKRLLVDAKERVVAARFALDKAQQDLARIRQIRKEILNLGGKP